MSSNLWVVNGCGCITSITIQEYIGLFATGWRSTTECMPWCSSCKSMPHLREFCSIWRQCYSRDKQLEKMQGPMPSAVNLTMRIGIPRTFKEDGLDWSLGNGMCINVKYMYTLELYIFWLLPFIYTLVLLV
jgi:hypothetical protein